MDQEFDSSLSQKTAQTRGVPSAPDAKIVLLDLVIRVNSLSLEQVLHLPAAKSGLDVRLFSDAPHGVACRSKVISEQIDSQGRIHLSIIAWHCVLRYDSEVIMKIRRTYDHY